MDVNSLTALSSELTEKARAATNGRAAQTIYGGQGHLLRQTVIALLEGEGLAEHQSPGEATLQVISGRVRLESASASPEGVAGDLMVIPPMRHSLAALEDSVVILTVVTH